MSRLTVYPQPYPSLPFVNYSKPFEIQCTYIKSTFGSCTVFPVDGHADVIGPQALAVCASYPLRPSARAESR